MNRSRLLRFEDHLDSKIPDVAPTLMWEWRLNIAGHVWHRSPPLALREGDWKLMMNPDRSRSGRYDLPRDRMQIGNLTDKPPPFGGALTTP
jgi:hypothetical protein